MSLNKSNQIKLNVSAYYMKLYSQNNDNLHMWVVFNNGSCSQIGNLHKRDQYLETTSDGSLFWSGKGLWDYLEVRNNERSP